MELEDFELEEAFEMGINEVKQTGKASVDEYAVEEFDPYQSSFLDMAREDSFTPDEEQKLIELHEHIDYMEQLGYDRNELMSDPEIVDEFYSEVMKNDVLELLDSRYSMEDINDEIEEESEFDVIREKTVFLKPQSVEEAILQMNLLGHQFYMFLNADTDCVNVVYKRNATGYGLISPDTDK